MRKKGIVSRDAAMLLLDALAVVGAAVVFVIWLIQYRRAQQWTLAEFLGATEMKELGSDLRASTAHRADGKGGW